MRLVLLPGAQPEDSFLPLPSPATPAHTPLDVSQEFICLSPCLSLPDRLCLSPPPFSLNSIYLQCLSVCLSPSHPSCAAVSLISLPFCGSFVLYVPLSLYLSECLFASWAVYLSVSLSVSQSLSQSVPCLSACFVPSRSLSGGSRPASQSRWPSDLGQRPMSSQRLLPQWQLFRDHLGSANCPVTNRSLSPL